VYAIKDTFPLFVLAVIAVMLGDHFENTVNSFGQSAEGKVCSTPLSAQQCPYVHNLESLKILRFFFFNPTFYASQRNFRRDWIQGRIICLYYTTKSSPKVRDGSSEAHINTNKNACTDIVRGVR